MPGGRPKTSYSQAARLLKVWEMLHHRAQITIPELMSKFAINRRTVQRDIATLTESYAVEEGERNDRGEKTFHLRAASRTETLKLTLAEMMALYMGKNLFAFTKGTQLATAMDSLYSKLQARLCARNVQVRDKLPKKLYCTTGFPKKYGGADDVMNDMLTGLVAEKKVGVTYKIPGRRPYRDVVHPYTLVAHNHALYVVGYSEHAQARRMFALERVLRSQWLRGATFQYPEDYDPAVELGAAFGISAGGRAERVRLRFSSRVAPYIEARQWHPSQRLRPRRGGGVEVTMTVSVGEELVHWLTGYGGAVQIVAPKGLRDAVLQRHAEVAAARQQSA